MQANDASFNTLVVGAQPSERIFPGKFEGGDLTAGSNSFIFEAVAPGEGTNPGSVAPHKDTKFNLKLDIRYPDNRLKTLVSTVDMDLRDVKEFYDIYQVNPSEADLLNPTITAFSAASEVQTAVVYDLPETGLTNDSYTLLVHGWNMAGLPDKVSFGETAYKRMYWQGYSGRFGILDWPTLNDGASPDPEIGLTYNPSEFIAFRSAAALAEILDNLHDDHPKVSMVAHSMGNIVAGEALRLLAVNTDGEQVIDTYIASQGAVAASAYHTEPGTSQLDLYSHAPVNGLFFPSATSAENWVNIYNPADYALGKWKLNNSIKSTLFAGIGSQLWPFAYSENPQTHELYRVGPGATSTLLEFVDANGELGVNAYEAMAFLASASTDPIGMLDLGATSRFESVPLSSLGFSSAKTPRGDGRPNHSFQFHHTAAITRHYWELIVAHTGT